MPTAYSQEERETFLEGVIEHMEAGKSLRESCKELGVPHPTILSWILQDDQQGGDLSDQFARARNSLRTVVAEDIISISDKTEEDPASRRVRMDARLKVLARLAPKRWGEKVQQEHSSPDGGPLKIEYVLPTNHKPEEGYDSGE